MTDSIEKGHAAEPVGQCAQYGDTEVDQPERLGGFGNTGCQFAVLQRSRRFRPVKLHTTNAQHGHDGDGQNDDTEATQPLKLLAVIQNATWQVIDIGQDGGTGGGQPGHGLEHGVHVRDFGLLQ